MELSNSIGSCIKKIQQLQKAAKWLSNKTKDDCFSVAVARDGSHAKFIAHVYKFERPARPSIWFCVEVEWLYYMDVRIPSQYYCVIKKIKRICTKL